MANAIASKDNPLTARVIVNRVWQYHFGRALVGTPSSFNASRRSADAIRNTAIISPSPFPPLSPREGSRRRRLVVPEVCTRKSCSRLSQTVEAGENDKDFNNDGDNRWLWRMNRRRLDVESWRDAMLAVSGKLDRTLGGPTTNLAAVENARRTVYAKVSRHDLNYLLRLFDFPDANITSERRTETTVPQQQLFVLNSPFVIETAKAFAARIQKEATSDTERVQRAFKLAYRAARERA